MSSSESEPEPTLPFDGLTFFVHGPQAGRTKNQMRRSIKANGGTVAKSITDAEATHCLCSAQLWSKQGTAAPDTTIAAILAANQDNRTEDDPDYNRVWLLPLEWLDECAKEGCKLNEAEWDFERTAEEKRIARAKELRKERAENDGKSKFGRGERRRYEREQREKRELALQAKLEKEGKLDIGDAFSGVAAIATSPTLDAVTSPSSPAVSPFDAPKFDRKKLKRERADEPLPGSRSSSSKPADSNKEAAASAPQRRDEKRGGRKGPFFADSTAEKPTTSSSATKLKSKPKPKPKPKLELDVSIDIVANKAKPKPPVTNEKGSLPRLGWPVSKPSMAGASTAKAKGVDPKAKGKGKLDVLELDSSNDDKPLAFKARKPRASESSAGAGAAAMGKGKKRELVLGSSDIEPEPVRASKKKKDEEVEEEVDELASTDED